MSITHVIFEDLSKKLNSGHALPFKLTLKDMATYYQVSLTPIRYVVDQLLEAKLLHKTESGRLRNPNSSALPSSAPLTDEMDKPSLQSDLDERVKQWIIQLSLDAFDGYLREEATAKQFGIGRTMIRQVLARMAGEGLIEHVPRCGWKVHQFREKDMLDYLELREMLEVKALRLARDKMDSEELQQLLSLNQQHHITNSVELDNQLHHYWIDRCDNRYIQAFFKQNSAFYDALFDYASLGDAIKPAMAAEHRAILEALIAQDWQTAEQQLIKHIRDQIDNVHQLRQKAN